MADTEVTLSAKGREATIWTIVVQIATNEKGSISNCDREYLLHLISQVTSSLHRR